MSPRKSVLHPDAFSSAEHIIRSALLKVSGYCYSVHFTLTIQEVLMTLSIQKTKQIKEVINYYEC